jgi:phospholipase C
MKMSAPLFVAAAARSVVGTSVVALAVFTATARASAAPRAGYGFPNIQHVVIVVQLQRSFDELFQAYPGADTQSYGYTSRGKKVALRPIPLEREFFIAHTAADFENAYDGGKNDGFNKERVACDQDCQGLILPQYSYVPASETKPYFSLASQYVLGDRMFGSTYDGDFETHLQLIGAQDAQTIGDPTTRPWGCDNPNEQTLVERLKPLGPVFPCFDFATLGDEMDSAAVSWRYYAAPNSDFGYQWSSFDAIQHIRFGADWANVVSPGTQFVTDVGNGKLADVTWINPTLGASDFSRSGTAEGPDYVASLVNAVGESKFWNNTAVFVTWSDSGGFYDHVAPPQDAHQGRAFRVPLLIVSPYVPQGRVTHAQYQTMSLLKFAEQAFGLKPLTGLDGSASSPAREFNFSQQPRTFVPISL